jgi:hypothetical protein
MTKLSVTIPLRLALGLNAREHWRKRASRVKAEKLAVLMYLRQAVRTLPPLPAVVTITRIGKRRCDSDNVPGGAKAVRDQIAAVYGVDDGSDLYDWRYGQEIGKEYGVRVDIASVPAGVEGAA